MSADEEKMKQQVWKNLQEESIRNTYDEMLAKNPSQKTMLDLMLKTRLQAIGVIEK